MNSGLTKDLVLVNANLTDVQRELQAMVLEKEKKKIHEGLFGKKGFMNVMSSKDNRKKNKIKTHVLTGKQSNNKDLLIDVFKAKAEGEEENEDG